MYVDDGVLAFDVISVKDDKTLEVRCRNNGYISSKKGVNLPNTDIDLPALDGTPHTDASLLLEAQHALADLAEEGVVPPEGGRIDHAKIIRTGSVVFTMSSVGMARWLLTPEVAAPFAIRLGLSARVVDRTYKLVAERVPVSFQPDDPAALREVEAAHDLRSGAIIRAYWIKPVARRFKGQQTAFLALVVEGVEQANQALRGLTLAGRTVLVRRDLQEPQRCSRCQSYDGHFARDCKAEHDTCATCAGHHPTSRCDVTDPRQHRCVNCGVQGHTAWDRDCPTLRAKVRARFARQADTGFRFFVTENPETWIHEGDDLARAPPPPSLWQQVRHQFEHADANYGPTQRSLNNFFPTQQSDHRDSA